MTGLDMQTRLEHSVNSTSWKCWCLSLWSARSQEANWKPPEKLTQDPWVPAIVRVAPTDFASERSLLPGKTRRYRESGVSLLLLLAVLGSWWQKRWDCSLALCCCEWQRWGCLLWEQFLGLPAAGGLLLIPAETGGRQCFCSTTLLRLAYTARSGYSTAPTSSSSLSLTAVGGAPTATFGAGCANWCPSLQACQPCCALDKFPFLFF